MYLVLGILLIVLGLVMVVFPEFIYELTESWKSDVIGPPSRWYIIGTQFGGVMCTLAGLGGVIILFIE